jgi:Pyruvate/2-oxoacid:ferredoxin oxidoreductase delta subunit
MVVSPSNAQAVMNICTCCGDSCNFLRGLKMFERPADHASSTYQAKIDPELCMSCETCVDRCQMEAIVEGDDAMRVDDARCIGCGLCVSTCSEHAVSMEKKPSAFEPPANFVAMQMKIGSERGLG